MTFLIHHGYCSVKLLDVKMMHISGRIVLFNKSRIDDRCTA